MNDLPCKKSKRALDSYGYVICRRGKYSTLHRYLYARHHGLDLTPDQVVRHICRNRWCVEITHLTLGTQKENLRDQAKLTLEKAQEIRRMYKTTNLTQEQIAERFGISRANVSYIIAGKTWKLQ